MFTDYSRKTTIKGQVYPEDGITKVYSRETGIINKVMIKDGQFVKKGEVLGVIYKAQNLNTGILQDKLKEQAILKKKTLDQAIDKIDKIHKSKLDSLHEHVESLMKQKENIKDKLTSQQNKLDRLKKNTNRYKLLERKGFISKEHITIAENSESDQLINLSLTKKELIDIERTISEKKFELEELPLKQFIEKQEIDRILASVNQEIINIESQTESVIVASSSGFININNFDLGSHVEQSTLLLNIVPNTKKFSINLYIPSQSIGFVKNGDIVNIRYSAYPYQKFGIFKAKVISISRTAIPAQEVKSIGTVFHTLDIANEPIYLVKAELEKQYIEINKIKKALEIGMTLDADILHEKRKLYEWIFEPLITINKNSI